MKLGSLKSGRDGRLVVISEDLLRCAPVRAYETLQAALDDWKSAEPLLRAADEDLEQGGGQPLDPEQMASPLPRAYQWCDGSAYLNHVELVRKARKAEMPPSFYTDPLMYQGGSDGFLGPRDPILCASEEFGIDFEAEVAVITDDVPMGVSAEAARAHIKLVMLVNDVSLRNLIPNELAKGFGFFHGKPASAFSPAAVTPDALGAAWKDGKLHLPLVCHLNDALCGQPNAGVDMQFDFGALIAHAARTRALAAGTIVGSGTVSNRDSTKGYCCLAEIRMIETIEHGKPRTPFMRFGDRIRIDMTDEQGRSIFGAIDQTVAPLS
jgi:fumarylacetoacetate (FAA) hydrolase